MRPELKGWEDIEQRLRSLDFRLARYVMSPMRNPLPVGKTLWSRALALSAAILLIFNTVFADCCTRAVYLGPNGNVITARSMDWKVDVGTNLWILPRGTQRGGQAGPHSLEWTSKYGSVVATGYDVSTTDGMNEKGLVANLLWLVESRYPEPKSDKPGLAISLWAQYVLDNFATVQEAVDALSQEPFTLITDKVPGEDRLASASSLHVGLDRGQRDRRVHRGQAGNPPWSRISSNDEFAYL